MKCTFKKCFTKMKSKLVLNYITCINCRDAVIWHNIPVCNVRGLFYFRPISQHTSTYDVSLIRLVLWDVFLVILFWIQHALMASKFFKNLLFNQQIIHFERTIYVATSAFVLQILMAFWEPITELYLWYTITIDRPVLWVVIFVVQSFAWIVLVLELLVLDPLELFGIKQIYFRIKGYADPIYYKSKALKQLYQHVRHPGMLTLCLALWIHPLMTYDRLILAVFLTLYQYYGHGVTMQDFFFVRDHFCYSYKVEVTSTRKVM